MSQRVLYAAGIFDHLTDAERAIAGLRAAGFATRDLAVMCPPEFAGRFAPELEEAEPSAARAPLTIAEGSVVGALGGVALAAATVATGGMALLPGAMMLIGGGAIAGGFGSLILLDGYASNIGDRYMEALANGQIVIAAHGAKAPTPPQAERTMTILRDAGAVDVVSHESGAVAT
jgi:hypothetical protein